VANSTRRRKPAKPRSVFPLFLTLKVMGPR